jgi:molybdenum cofactor cytidylyltransferase
VIFQYCSIFNGKLEIGNSFLFCYLPSMSRAPSFCAVVLAAGESTRMGTDKALLPWPPATGPGETGRTAASRQTFLSAAIAAFSPFADMVIVVAGGNEPVLAPVVYANGGELVQNPEPARGQFSSLQVGLQEVLNRGRDAAMITLVDRPPVSAATLKTLLAAFQTAVGDGKWAVVPEYRGKHGHPLLAGREMIEAFLRAPATATARAIQQQNQDHIEYVAVDDPSVTINLNTPEDYAALGVPR